ncbi:MAG: tetratricopeptide repeat protein [Phycisphaerales bacterium]
MAMKPRTFRRVVLLGSLGAIIFLVAFGYFVVRPWQNQRQLESTRRNGIAAYESGDYPTAVGQLGRYKRSSDNPEPEILLMHARASEKVEATDLGNYVVAIDSYRDYLRRVPGDVEAMKELLPLMNLRGLFVEAEGMARELIDTHQVDDISVLEELQISLVAQQANNEELEPVLRALFEHEDSGFNHANTYLGFLNSEGREAEADALLEQRIAEHPDRVDEQLLGFQRDVRKSQDQTEFADTVVLSEICSIIGLDPDQRTWAEDAPAIRSDVAWYLNRVFNSLRRIDLATTVQLRSAQDNGDWRNTTWAARRLYWAGRDEELNAMAVQTEKGEPDADMLGYQYLSAVRAGEVQRADELEQRIRETVLDRRASAWGAYIDALRAIDEADAVKSRLALQDAIEWYMGEPTFRLTMGDLQLDQGRFNEAIENWVVSSEIVNGEMGSDYSFDTFGWPVPLIKVIEAYGSQDRLVETFDYIQELQRVAPTSSRAVYVALSALSQLARQDQLPQELGQGFVSRWNEFKGAVDAEDRAQVAPQVATILASMGQFDDARSEISLGLQAAQSNQRLLASIVEVDQRYQLGVAESLGIDTDSVIISSPVGALRAANRAYLTSGRLEDGLEILDRALANAPEDEQTSWARVRLTYLDEFAPEQAKEEWQLLMDSSPDNVELKQAAIESKAYMNDLAEIDRLIDQVVAMTETQGKAIPSRLRLARANAMVSGIGKRTRTNRESALGIVRSVVASEPSNTKARNALGRLLALPPSPGLDESERYTPDFEGAIEQYVTLSRQLSGREAQNYLLESVDLAFRNEDETRALSLLDEYEARFADNLLAMTMAAERFENLGADDRAISIYRRVLSERGDTTSALALADLLLKQGQSTQAKSLVEQVEQVETLTDTQLLRLASVYVRLGEHEDGERLASSGERYGLEPLSSKLLHARFAGLYLGVEREVELLREATEIEPKSLNAWKRLVLRLIRSGREEHALSAYTTAIEYVSPDEELTRYGMMMRDAPQTAEEMLRLPGMQDNPRLEQVVRLVGRYTSLDEEASAEDRFSLLEQLISDFPEIEQAQIFGVERATALRLEPGRIAGLTFDALQNVPWNTRVMQVAGQMHLQANDASGALRVVSLWRANSLETSIIANAIRARALIISGELESAQSELEPFVDQALGSPTDPVSREVLDAYSYIRLSLEEDPSTNAARLSPLISGDRFIRNQTWLRLASSVVPDPDVGADWIETAESYAIEDDALALASAWITLAFTHERWDPEFAQSALEHLDPILDTNPGPEPLLLAARAHLILARGADDQGAASQSYDTVVTLISDASAAAGGSVMLLLDAAQFATEGQLYERSESLYQQMLDQQFPDPALNAIIQNNLAMSMIRAGLQESERERVLALVQQATQSQPDQGAYWGTRGWVELELEMFEAALESFTRCSQLSPSSAEGWVGLAIVHSKRGDEYEEDQRRALSEVRRIAADSGLDEELESYLDANGLDDWAE